jgi:ABC-type cobalamin/Fe3+-siderophores transport system ATPase subunit
VELLRGAVVHTHSAAVAMDTLALGVDMKKGGIAIIVVGCTGSGKSTLIKSFTKSVDRTKLFINDVNAEYFPDREYISTTQFLEIAQKLKECVIVFEEATIFFSNRGSNKEMRELLVRKRHARNVIFLVFHSVRSIPHYIYDLCNYVFIFRTNDTAELVEKKHEHLFPAWRKVQNKRFVYGKDVFDFCEIVKLN